MTKKPQKTTSRQKTAKKTELKKNTIKKLQKTSFVKPKKRISEEVSQSEVPLIETRKTRWQNVFATLFALMALLTVTMVFMHTQGKSFQEVFNQSEQEEDQGGPKQDLYPLTIEYMRQQEYSGSTVTIEETLPSGSNYDRYLASYRSDGLKIFALLTVPQGEKPKTGWPVIIFNHGYIPPEEYQTTERYVEYTDAFSRNGYIVFKSDYRGHGNSEGNPEGGYYSPAYTIDVLNAVATMKKYKDADASKIGMWGHSMGGNLTLRTMVTTKDIKAGVIWAGVVSDYADMDKKWTRSYPFVPSAKELDTQRLTKEVLVKRFGSVDQNPTFWESIAPITYAKDVSGPIQIHHGTNDGEVPVLFSERLDQALKKAKKPTELYIYEADDHNIALNLYVALDRSVAFFDKYLK